MRLSTAGTRRRPEQSALSFVPSVHICKPNTTSSSTPICDSHSVVPRRFRLSRFPTRAAVCAFPFAAIPGLASTDRVLDGVPFAGETGHGSKRRMGVQTERQISVAVERWSQSLAAEIAGLASISWTAHTDTSACCVLYRIRPQHANKHSHSPDNRTLSSLGSFFSACFSSHTKQQSRRQVHSPEIVPRTSFTEASARIHKYAGTQTSTYSIQKHPSIRKVSAIKKKEKASSCIDTPINLPALLGPWVEESPPTTRSVRRCCRRERPETELSPARAPQASRTLSTQTGWTGV